ncbi:Putative peptide zinc metalloprotease protein YydH [Anatilimnocola aggregata]|uniref:Peptide zinc metalloprotease protein YydH n=1 Tax=Anatilimnocola aggregata TaxID=2528021 RepID=A0A517Y7C0_9BACT|nr:biotin/lipoyl-binding protein [Anatilimnocola aggregata]QDU26105.1 Putative peptide zinc metalloprotease protein YydH [Anatilimnocola aggregata]
MATLAESLVSSTSRPLLLRMRPDLQARRHRYRGQTFWVIKEPVGLNYFRFHEEEYAILCMLDGLTSLETIKEQFESQFAPQKITYTDLLQFVGMLHRSGLVISESPGQGRALKKRRDEKKHREFMGKLANVFALRFRGVDPERFLNWLYKYTWWFFTWTALFINLGIGLAALSLVVVQFDQFTARLPAFHEFFGPRNWFILAIVMGTVKVLHEFGHGLSCKHFGGECHELGAMLLVFTPALYCNVSDSWMLPNKWARAAIGAAGMYVELVLASIATFIWWFSAPGLLNHVALSVMFICSVSTVVFNGNPLLRFDGYYILMDLLEIPNLQQKAKEVLKRFMIDLCLGIEQAENPFLPQGNRFIFGLYTVASALYRWVVVFSILFFLNSVFEPYGLKIIGQLIALSGFFGLVVQPIWGIAKFFYTPGRMHKVKKERVIATACVVVAVVAAIFFVPLPYSVTSTFEVQAHDAAQVFSAEAGQVAEVFVKPGAKVQKDQPLLRLHNPDLELELKRLEGRYLAAKEARENLNTLRFTDSAAVDQLETAEEVLAAARKQFEDKQREYDRLTIRAPRAGIVIPPPTREAKAEESRDRLASWTGHPFQAKNQGAPIMPTDLICQIGDPQDLEAVLIVDQAYIDLVRSGPEPDKVRLLLDSYTRRAYESYVAEIGANEMKAVNPALSSRVGGRLETVTDPSGATRPLSSSYPVRAPLKDLDGDIQVGMQGQARIYTGWQPISSRVYRYVAKTFHFDL